MAITHDQPDERPSAGMKLHNSYIDLAPGSLQPTGELPLIAAPFAHTEEFAYQQEMMGGPPYQLGIIEIERFFSAYIDQLFTLVDQATLTDEKIADAALGNVILLARDLRELTFAQWNAHCSSLVTKRNAFFSPTICPQLKPILNGDFVAKEAISLGQYLMEYSRRYSTLVDPELSKITCSAIRVGVAELQNDTHYLILPKHHIFMKTVMNNELYSMD